jgi:hypothetical protein
MKATITKKIADLLDKTVTISNSVHTQVTENDWRKLGHLLMKCNECLKK